MNCQQELFNKYKEIKTCTENELNIIIMRFAGIIQNDFYRMVEDGYMSISNLEDMVEDEEENLLSGLKEIDVIADTLKQDLENLSNQSIDYMKKTINDIRK